MKKGENNQKNEDIEENIAKEKKALDEEYETEKKNLEKKWE